MVKRESSLPQVEIQEAFLPLLTVHKRYKLYHGGRGGGKSYAFADAILLLARTKKLRVACIREVQNSIKDSVYQLLRDRCDMHGFDDFIFYEDRVVNSFTGSTIIFKGMNNNNAANIKSLEGVDLCWCFPAGTKIDGRNIEDIKVGDYVTSFNHKTGQVEQRQVLKTMRRKCPDEILKLTFAGSQRILCTKEHPIFVKGKGYVPARNVKKGDIVYACETRPAISRSLFGWLWGNDTNRYSVSPSEVCEERRSVLFGLHTQDKLGTYEEKQSYEQSRIIRKNAKNNYKARLQTENSRWKWSGLFESTRTALENTWSWLVGGTHNTNKTLSGYRRSAVKLQSRPCEHLLRNSNRGRWWFSLWRKGSRGGQKENRVLREQRVESVKIQKQTGLKRLGLSDCGNYVYNFEVQGNNNYFANGLLVHNCEEGQVLSEKSWNILDPTIRKENSEIWVSMNREEEYDPVWKAIAVNPTDNALIVKVNYYDNKFCPDTLKIQAERMKETDFLRYLHIWEGEPVQEGDHKLINLVDVRKALDTTLDPSTVDSMPLILGVDVARFGDDKTAIARRKGRQIYDVTSYSNMSVTQVANLVKNIIHEEHPAIVNIDVGGLGAGVYDILVEDGYQEIARAVNFGEKAQEEERFCNRRAEMWARLRDWLTAELPVSMVNCKGLTEDLTAPFKDYDKLGRLLLEKKADIKKRIGRSTDVGDAVALCFAEREYPRWLAVRSNWQTAEYTDDNVYMEA